MGKAYALPCRVSVIMELYGGASPTISAYLADVFGTQYVGARSTAGWLRPWSAARHRRPLCGSNYISPVSARFHEVVIKCYDLTIYLWRGR